MSENDISLTGSRVSLVPVAEEHFEMLHHWRNDISDLMLWSSVRSIIPKHEYWQELKNDYQNGIIRLVIKDNKTAEIIGQVFAYNQSIQNQHIFIGVFISREKRKFSYGVEATAVFVKYLFYYFSVHKIYYEIFEFNKSSFDVVSKCGFGNEGAFLDHINFNGRFWTLYRFAMYRKDLQRMNAIIKRVTRNERG